MNANGTEHHKQPHNVGQWINFRALQWAYDQDDLNVTTKATLMTFAMHANERGYTWPGVERIASAWGMDRETVRRQIGVLVVRRLIHPTKKRRGATGQVKVYRLPKVAYESSGKARDKRGISGGKSTPNNDNNRTTNKRNDQIALGNSMPSALGNGSAKSGSSFFEGYQNQNQPVQNHVKWPEFVAWCRRKGGQPTEKGFWTWWGKQKPQWRNKVKQSFDQTGYVLHGQFLTIEEANRMGKENPELLTQFRKATKGDDKIDVLKSPSDVTQKSA